MYRGVSVDFNEYNEKITAENAVIFLPEKRIIRAVLCNIYDFVIAFAVLVIEIHNKI